VKERDGKSEENFADLSRFSFVSGFSFYKSNYALCLPAEKVLLQAGSMHPAIYYADRANFW
jgi:hypothetical protein